MKPMFSSLLLRKFAAESVCKSFYIGVFAQSIVFSAQDKCFMIPRFDRMFFDICVIRKIQRFYIVLHFHSFPELFSVMRQYFIRLRIIRSMSVTGERNHARSIFSSANASNSK